MNRCTTTCSMICSAIEVGSQSLQQRLALPGSRLLLRGTAMTFGAKTGSPSDSFSYDFIWFHMISWSESRRNHMISSIYIYTLIKKYIYIYYQYHINIIEYNTSKYCQFGTSKSWSWGGWLGALPLLRWWTSECTHDPFVSIPCDEITVEIRQVGTPIHRRVLPLTQGAKCTAWSLPVAIVAIVMP